MDPIRVGLIGAGHISDLHAIKYLGNPHAAIAALCARAPALAAERGRAWGWKTPRSACRRRLGHPGRAVRLD